MSAPDRRVSIVFEKTIGLSLKLIGKQLGDSWRAVNTAVHMHKKFDRPIGIYTMLSGKNNAPINCKHTLQLCLDQLDLPYVPPLIGEGIPVNATPFCTGCFPNVPTHHNTGMPPVDYFPTKRKRVPPGKYFTYQLYGNSNPRNQNFSRAYGIEMVLRLQRRGFVEKRVGLPLSLDQSVALMCGAAFHVGIDSGMTHIARSVGLPIYMYQARLRLDWINGWHPAGSVNIFKTLEELESMLERDKLLV